MFLTIASICSSRSIKREKLSVYVAPGSFSTVPLPSGAASGSYGPWLTQSNVEGWMFYLSSSTQLFDDPALYTYSYYISNPATLTLTLSSVQAGTWYGRYAPIESGILGPLSQEVTIVTT